jgi:hypothetical protein
MYDSLAVGDRGDFTTGQSTRLTKGMAQEAFRCLIEEEPIPVTMWNRDWTQVTIVIGDQKDVVDFAMTESGRTALRITRNGKDIVRMD